MIPLYTYLLKIYGLKGLLSGLYEDDVKKNKETELRQVVIDIGEDGDIKKDEVSIKIPLHRRWYVRYPINTLQFLMVFSIITWPCVYAVVKAIKDNQFRYISSNIFTFLFVVQYVVGYIYYQTSHFRKTMKFNEQYTRFLNIAFILGLCASIALTCAYAVLLGFGINIHIYTELYDNTGTAGKVLLVIAYSITSFFSYNVFFSNLIVFVYIFWIHSHHIDRYSKRLSVYINDVTAELTINSIISEYSELKSQHTQSVNELNTIFSSITVLGVLSAYFMSINYGTNYLSIVHYIEIICFLIIEFTYIYTISRLKLSVADIGTATGSPQFIARYLSRTQLGEFLGDADKDEDSSIGSFIDRYQKKVVSESRMDLVQDLSFRSMIKSHENAESIDWMVLTRKLAGSWENFKVFGFEMDDSTLIQKALVVVTVLIGIIHFDNEYTI